MSENKIDAQRLREHIGSLKCGDSVLLTGYIFTTRDAAHKRLFDMEGKGQPLPISFKDAIIYYAGPTPEREGMAAGSCGPTTSGRMDAFTPRFIEMGLVGMIGKGKRSEAVVEAMKAHGCVYFGAIGGAGALASKCIKSNEVIAFSDLGCESLKRMYVEDFPLTVIIDSKGNDLYEVGRKNYLAGNF